MKARLLSGGTWICGKTNISKRLTGPQFSFIFTIQNNLSIEREELVFSGSALEAIRSFPKNVNVAVAAALSGVGPENTTVEIVSVPGLEENSHCIYGQNKSVRVTLETSSLPDPSNPRSSTLAAWSVVSLLQNLASPFQF